MEFSRKMKRLNYVIRKEAEKRAFVPKFAHFEMKDTFEYEDPIKLNHRQISDYRRWILIRHNEIRCKSEQTTRCKIALRFSDEVRYMSDFGKEETKRPCPC